MTTHVNKHGTLKLTFKTSLLQSFVLPIFPRHEEAGWQEIKMTSSMAVLQPCNIFVYAVFASQLIRAREVIDSLKGSETGEGVRPRMGFSPQEVEIIIAI